VGVVDSWVKDAKLKRESMTKSKEIAKDNHTWIWNKWNKLSLFSFSLSLSLSLSLSMFGITSHQRT
jgi:hypothetical protein